MNQPKRGGRWSGLLAALAAGLLAATAAGQEPPTTITYRLMAYNVGCGANIPFGQRQIDQIADIIVDNAVDIAGITEIDLGTEWYAGRDHGAELCVALAKRGYPMHIHAWPAFRYEGGWQRPVLLSRWPIHRMGYYKFPSAPGHDQNWAVGWIEVDVAENTPIRACMTHFWPVGDCAAQVKALIEAPLEFDGPCTIMGDFNTTPKDQTLYPLIKAAGWRNSCEVVHGAPCPTVQGQAGISGPLPLSEQIDYIWGNDRIQFLQSYVGYFSMSDHWPIFAEVAVAKNGRGIERDGRYAGMTETPALKARATAAAYYRNGQYPEAATAYRAWEKLGNTLDDRAFAAYSQASMLLLAGDAEAAHDAFGRVIDEYGNTEWSARSHYRLAFLDKDAGAPDKAEREFLAYLDGYYTRIHRDPRAPLVWITAHEIANCREQRGETVDVAHVLRELAKRRPGSMTARAAAYRIAYNYFTAGNYEEAAPWLQQADPPAGGEWPNEAHGIAETYMAIGQVDKAKPFIERYLAGLPNELVRRTRRALWQKRLHPAELYYKMPAVERIVANGDLSDWSCDPIVTLQGEPHEYRIDPAGASDDLIAKVYVGWSNDWLSIAVDVTDAITYCPYHGADIFKGDSLQIAVDPDLSATTTLSGDDIELGVALTDTGVEKHVWFDKFQRDWSALAAGVKHADGHTVYEVKIPMDYIRSDRSLPKRIGLDVLINDADGGERVRWIDWTPGIGEEKRPELYPVLELHR